jgi:hypothetical protein
VQEQLAVVPFLTFLLPFWVVPKLASPGPKTIAFQHRELYIAHKFLTSVFGRTIELILVIIRHLRFASNIRVILTIDIYEI